MGFSEGSVYFAISIYVGLAYVGLRPPQLMFDTASGGLVGLVLTACHETLQTRLPEFQQRNAATAFFLMLAWIIVQFTITIVL